MPNNIYLPSFHQNCDYLFLKKEFLKNGCFMPSTTQNTTIEKTPSNTYYLEHSTDTTAMKSFDYAVVIALLLAFLATWLAWWYGKKSFKLTQQAFEQSILQIQASIQSAENNTNATLKSNQEILNNQINIQANEFKFKEYLEIKNELIDLSISFVTSGKKIYFLISPFVNNFVSDHEWRDFIAYSSPNFQPKLNTDFINIHQEVMKEIENMLDCLLKFGMITDHNKNDVIRGMDYLKKATDLAIEQKAMHMAGTISEHRIKLESLNSAIQDARLILKIIIADRDNYIQI